MNKKVFGITIPILIIAMLVLSACNLPGLGNTPASESQIQTMAAATVAAQLGQYLTQTAQAVQYVVVTATPKPTAIATALPPATATDTAIPATAVPPTATAIPIPCNQATFIDDISIPDGTSMTAGTPFVKTWRIRNTGTCTWGTNYVTYFVSGNSMSGAATVAFPNSVRPGETVDISIPLVAPTTIGDFTGSWKFRAPNGDQFGVGTAGGVPVTVVIKVIDVPKSKDPNIVYDFVKNYCSAEWRTNGSFISCPSAAINYTTGSITRTYTPILETGGKDDEGTIITVPATGGDGFIQGQYPKYLVHVGDHIAGTLLCSYKKTNCSVTFEILAQINGSSTIKSLGTWNKTLDNKVLPINVDISSYDGKEVIFYLKVSSGGNSTDDMAQWMAIRITHP